MGGSETASVGTQDTLLATIPFQNQKGGILSSTLPPKQQAVKDPASNLMKALKL
jgi:hypothetical protein